MITLTDIYGIFRQIVIDFPYSQDRRLNTFAVIDDRTELNTENFEKNYEQYKSGYFWSRSWVTSGAVRGQEKREYDALIVESKRLRLLNVQKRNGGFLGVVEIGLSILSPEKCTGCRRSWEQIDNDNREIMINVLAELFRYRLYTLTTVSQGPVVAWISEQRAALLKSTIGDDPDLLDVSTCMEDISHLIEADLDIFSSNFGVDNIRSVSTILQFKGCHVPVIEFDYNNKSFDEKGIVICSNCN